MVTLLSRERIRRPYLDLGRAIASARRRADLTQHQMADLAHISKGYPGQIEGGQVRPEPETLRAIAAAVSVPYEALAELAGYLRPALTDADTVEDLQEVEQFKGFPKRLRRRLLRIGDEMVQYEADRDSDAAGDRESEE